MRPRIKICGLSEPDTLRCAVEHGADYIGLVHFPKSPRHVSCDDMARLAALVPPHIGRVAVVVDPDDALLDALLASGVTAIQLHGRESVERVAEVKQRTGLEVWKAVPIATADDVTNSIKYAGVADFLLYDAKPAQDAPLPGGMGHSFDWTVLSSPPHTRWGLAGGIDITNSAEALRITHAPLLDVSSGVESALGQKSIDKIRAFLQHTSL